MTAAETNKKTPTIIVQKGELLKTALQVDPGVGAVKFAMQYVMEMTLDHVEGLCVDLIDGNFEEIGDKKVRRCQFCGYYYRDGTKNNSSLTCSDVCKTGKDIVLKAYRRKVENEGKPKRPTFKQLYYCEYHDGVKTEYPHWASEFLMYEYDRKHEAYTYGDNLEQVIARDLLNAKMGGKKNAKQIIDYDGYEDVLPFAVKLSEKQHKTTEIIVTKCIGTEIEAYLLEQYGAVKLEQERKRARMFAKGHYD